MPAALFTASAAGTYFRVGGRGGRRAGTYTLSIERWVGVGEASDEDFDGGTLRRGAGWSGPRPCGPRLDPSNDRDWFAAHLIAGHRYRIFLKLRIHGGHFQPEIDDIRDSDAVFIPGTGTAGDGDGAALYFDSD